MGAAITNDFRITARQLGHDEAVKLSRAIRETPNILGYLPKELQKIKECLVAETPEGDFAGVCLVKRLSPDWSDVAVLYVFEEYRRRGLGAALFWTALRSLSTQGGNVLCISREPSVLRLMQTAGLRPIKDWQLPMPVQLARRRHYQSLYRFGEAWRKSFKFFSQPPFRSAACEASSLVLPPG